MDRLSSPTVVASRATTTTQPTYTTAGTIYKPVSNQPLQPPTRRGRSFKWANGVGHTELSFLPKSVLATLPLRSATTRASLLQQYSPLQQNYDRAVSPSPFADSEHALVKMPTTPAPPTGRTDDSATSVLSSLFAGSSDERNLCDESETDESDGELSMDPLAGMPFKSLQNLASYPNPMQSKARKALNVKPVIQASDVGRPSPKSAYTRPIGSPPKGSLKTDAEWDGPLKPLSSLGTGQRLFETGPGPTTLSEGPGAPRPLTAGPPGQRQYRSGTFEATYKALRTNVQQNNESKGNILDPIQSIYPKLSSGDQWSQYRPSPVPRVDSVMGTNSLSVDNNVIIASDWPLATPQGSEKSDASLYTLTGWNEVTFQDPKLQKLRRFQPGTDRLTEQEIKARDERNAAAWNTGAGLLNKSIEDLCSESQSRYIGQNHGAIGDGRPGKKVAQYPPMSIHEANALSAPRHARPLLNMAFNTLLRYRDQDWAGVSPSHSSVGAEGEVTTSKLV